jgi:hypothetical protein
MYNGYKNWETWVFVLNLETDESIYFSIWKNPSVSLDEIKDRYNSFAWDKLTPAEFSQIDWEEVQQVRAEALSN